MNTRMMLLAAAAAGLIGAASAEAAPDAARAEACRAKLARAQEAGVLKDLGVERSGVQMVVDGATWRAVDYATKTEMVRTVVCLITQGDETKTARIEVRDHADNRVVGRYSGRRLEIP